MKLNFALLGRTENIKSDNYFVLKAENSVNCQKERKAALFQIQPK